MDLVDRPVVERQVGALLLSVTPDDTGRGGLPEHVPVEYPHGLAVDVLDAWHTVPVLDRRDAREEVVGLRPVRVGIDDQRVVVEHWHQR